MTRQPAGFSFAVWDADASLSIFAQSKTYQITNPVNLNDAFLYKLLWESGPLDLGRMIASIDEKYYDSIISPKTVRRMHSKGNLEPTDERLLRSVLQHYRQAGRSVGAAD